MLIPSERGPAGLLHESLFDDQISIKLRKIANEYEAAQINTEMHPDDGGIYAPTLERYLEDGRSAMRMVFRGLHEGKISEPRSILDMPSGYGRVLRHLTVAFPNAETVACDIVPAAVDFCRNTLGAKAALSQDDFSSMSFDRKFDLIWCGSLLSHLPRHKFVDCLGLFSRSLSPNGIAVVTLHGRYSARIGRGVYLPPDSFRPVEEAYYRAGFGYADYVSPAPEMINNYGITLSSPSFTFTCLESDASIRVLTYCERAWDNHQDVLIFQKTPLCS